MIEFNGVTFSYRTEDYNALDHISLTFRRGEWTSVIGHNGSGKSTLVKLLMGVLEGYEGEIRIDGEILTEENLQDIRRRFAIVFQNPDNQFVGATVEDDVAFGLENNGVERGEMSRKVEEALRAVNMLEFRSHEPSRLSGGQKQRVAIAGALAMEPDLIIVDESTSMLGSVARYKTLCHSACKTTWVKEARCRGKSKKHCGQSICWNSAPMNHPGSPAARSSAWRSPAHLRWSRISSFLMKRRQCSIPRADGMCLKFLGKSIRTG